MSNDPRRIREAKVQVVHEDPTLNLASALSFDWDRESPWRLGTIRPEVAAHIEENKEDFTAQLAAADLVEEAGFPEAAERYRWIAGAKRVPRTDWGSPYFDKWGWRTNHAYYPWCLGTSSSDPLFRFRNNGYWIHYLENTYWDAMDALVAFLLTLETNPLLKFKET